MKKIKILHLTSTRYGIGGVERLLLDMSEKYDFSRFEIAYCNLFCDAEGDGFFPTELKKRGLKYFTISGRSWSQVPKILYELTRLIQQENFDILHLHMLQATIIGGLSTLFQKRTRTILTKHYTEALLGKSVHLKRADLYFTKQASRVIAISDYVKKDLLRIGVDENLVVTVPNGIDLKRFDELGSGESGVSLPEGKRLIGTIGSLTKRKGHRTLVEAMPTIVSFLPDVHLLIIGEGPEKSDLDELVDELDLTNSVSITGFVPNVAPILTKLELYVHPSINEPFGIAILEAMAARKCVIATAVEGVPEIVLNDKTGHLVKANDPAVLAKFVIRALSDPTTAKRMGDAGRERVERQFSLEETVRGYEEVYISVAAA